MRESPAHDGTEKETGRVEAFSDGVFAIAMTLLILDVKVPQGAGRLALPAALLDQWPACAAALRRAWRSAAHSPCSSHCLRERAEERPDAAHLMYTDLYG
jgi:hypothetical protein